MTLTTAALAKYLNSRSRVDNSSLPKRVSGYILCLTHQWFVCQEIFVEFRSELLGDNSVHHLSHSRITANYVLIGQKIGRIVCVKDGTHCWPGFNDMSFQSLHHLWTTRERGEGRGKERERTTPIACQLEASGPSKGLRIKVNIFHVGSRIELTEWLISLSQSGLGIGKIGGVKHQVSFVACLMGRTTGQNAKMAVESQFFKVCFSFAFYSVTFTDLGNSNPIERTSPTLPTMQHRHLYSARPLGYRLSHPLGVLEPCIYAFPPDIRIWEKTVLTVIWRSWQL